MPKASPIQTNFTAGEWSPLLDGRVDLSKYSNACKTLQNFVSMAHGPARRRSGARHVVSVKTAANQTGLIPFEFSVVQAYIIEVGDLYLRFYRDNGRIEDPPGTPVEVVSPYVQADLFDSAGRFLIKFAQSADVLYLVHPNYEPRKLTRTSHIAWTLTTIDPQDGPFLVTNITATTLGLSGTSGSVTVTASAVAGINRGSGFLTTDVGRLIRWQDPANDWTWLEITAHTSTTVVTATIRGPNASAGTATTTWRLGVWSDTTGWPSSVIFFEERLTFAGPTDNPQRMDLSRSGDFENFQPTDPDGTVVGDHALALTLSANNVNAIRWLMDDEKGLQVGTTGGEWIVRPNTLDEVLTPDNATGRRSSNYGSANLMAFKIGRATYYVQRSGRELRELAYVFEDDGFRSPDMSLLAEHITGTGIVGLAYQQQPDRVLWAARADGVLVGMTINRVQDVIGWHQHPLGGFSDAGQTTGPVVESIAAIPSSDGSRDELWMVVRRFINGATVRYVEYLDDSWDDGDQVDAFFVDSGLSYDGAPATVFSGLDHLEGQTVAILADGAVTPTAVVVSGAVTITEPASRVHIGLPITYRLQTMRFEAGAADGTAQGKIKRIHRVVFRFYRSLGPRAGPDVTRLDDIPDVTFRDPATLMGTADPLFSGDARITWPGSYETAGHVVLEGSEPLPCTVIAIMPQLLTQDT